MRARTHAHTHTRIYIIRIYIITEHRPHAHTHTHTLHHHYHHHHHHHHQIRVLLVGETSLPCLRWFEPCLTYLSQVHGSVSGVRAVFPLQNIWRIGVENRLDPHFKNVERLMESGADVLRLVGVFRLFNYISYDRWAKISFTAAQYCIPISAKIYWDRKQQQQQQQQQQHTNKHTTGSNTCVAKFLGVDLYEHTRDRLFWSKIQGLESLLK